MVLLVAGVEKVPLIVVQRMQELVAVAPVVQDFLRETMEQTD